MIHRKGKNGMDGIQREMIRNRVLGNRYQRQETRSEEQQ